MKQLRLLYFSATGNTKRAVGIIGESCSSAGIAVETVELLDPSAALLASPSRDTETMIAFPALGFGAPNMVLKRARSLPRGKGAVARVLAVCGAEMRSGRALRGWPGSGPEQLEAILRRKGYDVASSGFVSYPSNWVQMSDPPSGEARASLLAAGDAEARRFAEAVIEGERSLYRCGPGNRLWTAAVNFLFRAVGRRVLGKFYAADPSCTGCALCAKSCPARSIRMRKGRPTWKLSCEDCNRCINVCPAEAIQVSVAKMALYLLVSIACYVAAVAAGGRLMDWALPGAGTWAKAAVALAVVAAVTPPVLALIAGPLDALVALASRAPAVGRLFSRGYTVRFGRYREPGFRP